MSETGQQIPPSEAEAALEKALSWLHMEAPVEVVNQVKLRVWAFVRELRAELATANTEIETLRKRVAELERERDVIKSAWSRIAGFAVCESCGALNLYRITIDYKSLKEAQDAYSAILEITQQLATKGGEA